jgi:endonuclease-3
MAKKSKALLAAHDTFHRLHEFHSDAHCELEHKNPFELVVATVLSAQTTDVLVNRITPDLFRAYPDAASLARANPDDVQKILSRMGMFRQKTKNIIGLAQKLVANHGGEVPRTLAELVELPGVGRKTANVVLGVAFNSPEGVVVDTHVQRISQRLGWTRNTEPVTIEQDLMALFPQSDWDMLSHVLIFHGRRVCFARKPSCATCPVNDICPCAFKAENVGRKPPRVRTPSPTKKKAKAPQKKKSASSPKRTKSKRR